jgi:precorrin-8X/cobalt-precorrin-8 methylmutase
VGKVAVIVVGHGSRKSTYTGYIASMAKYIEERLGLPVHVAYNEFNDPHWQGLIGDLVRGGFDRLIFALAFLGPGTHVVRDIMCSLGVERFGEWVRVPLRDGDVQVYFTEPLGSSNLTKLALHGRILRALGDQGESFIEDPVEIEEGSLGIIEERLRERLGALDEGVRRVITKAVFASGNLEVADRVHVSRDAIESGLEALRSGVGIVADVKMVAVGIRWSRVEVHIDSNEARELARGLGITRAAAAMRIAMAPCEPKVVVIGNAPTALVELLRVSRQCGEAPPLVVATPPGFTNAVEAKEALVRSGIPSITVRGTYGGSGIAVSIINEVIGMVSGRGG